MNRLWLLVGAVCLFSATVVAAEDQTRYIVAVDGDTVIVDGEEIHLRGVDAPELDQPFGAEAKRTLQSILQSLPCGITKPSNRGPKGRLATISIHGAKANQSAGQMLISMGLAWSTDPKAILPSKNQKLMASAKRNHKNLWSDPNPINPESWRRNPSRHSVDLGYLAEKRYEKKQQFRAEEARRVAVWNQLVVENPALAQQIVAEQNQKKRDEKIQKQLKQIRSNQEKIKEEIEDIDINPVIYVD